MARDVLIDGRTLFVGHSDRAGVSDDDDGGLYHRDVRHMSALSATVEGADIVTVGRDLPASDRRTVVGTTNDSTINRVDETEQKRADLVFRESQAVGERDGLAGRVVIGNHSPSAFVGTLAVTFDVDFADLFEIRGHSVKIDREVTTSIGERTIQYTYTYENDGGSTVEQTTVVAFDRPPETLTEGRATFEVSIQPQEYSRVKYAVVPAVVEDGAGEQEADTNGLVGPDDLDEPNTVDLPAVSTGRRDYDRVFERAGDDLAALTTETEHGAVPLAGAPWFATVFGRDSLITAYQVLPLAPSLASGTLRYLAAHQGTTDDERSEEAPGKVFHEMRDGELARRGLIPYTPYYGSIDATPLWVVVLAEHHRWTGDDSLVRELSDGLDAAIAWIEEARGTGTDPFLYYDQSPTTELLHKAWRDTPGAIQFPDGRIAEPPIASVEVQGYVYRALRDAADLYEGVLGETSRARTLNEEADELAAAFESEFWLADQEFYAAAKTGTGTIVPTLTSNVGHCLWSEVLEEERALAVARGLRSKALFSGWGLRTMSPSADGYSPVSYHLGSVWPHDTSLTALGLARYGFEEEAERLTRGVLDAGTHFDDSRLPELFCGFDDDIAPKPYPSSCVPQAWSAGAPFALLRAVFGLEPSNGGEIEVGTTPELLTTEAIAPIRDRWKR